MRRVGRFGLTAVAVALVAAGCGEAPGPRPVAADLLYFQTSQGVTVAAAGAREAPPQTPGIPSTDWSSVVTAQAGRQKTDVEAVDAVTGETEWKTSIEGRRLRVKVVSHEAEMVALAPQFQRHYTAGRTKTTLVVAGRAVEPRTIELDGNYDPEAFSTDGNSVFLLEYLPAENPNSYRVRRLDLATEEVSGVFSVDAELQERMRGTARVQTMSPDGKFLYTLYTAGISPGHRSAFIHVLSLDELWAHCIDLPPEYGKTAGASTAVAVTPDSKRLFVFDSDEGLTSEIDTQSLEVLSTETVQLNSGYHPVTAHDGEHTLYVAQGPHVSALDTEKMTVGARWILQDRVKGLQISADGSKVYAAVGGTVMTLEAATGAERELPKPPGVGKVRNVGRVMQRVEDPYPLDKVTCAC